MKKFIYIQIYRFKKSSPLEGESKSLLCTRYRGNGYNFEDLHRELLLRKYSYKTVKDYLYYNKDFLRFTDKNPDKMNNSDIKDYLFLSCQREKFATSIINQIINALKFYYGTMLKKRLFFEMKKPRKDKKLPIVLSKEEITKILSFVDNLKHKAILIVAYFAILRGRRSGEIKT